MAARLPRRVPFVAIYVDQLDDPDVLALPDDSYRVLHRLMLACRRGAGNGEVPVLTAQLYAPDVLDHLSNLQPFLDLRDEVLVLRRWNQEQRSNEDIESRRESSRNKKRAQRARSSANSAELSPGTSPGTESGQGRDVPRDVSGSGSGSGSGSDSEIRNPESDASARASGDDVANSQAPSHEAQGEPVCDDQPPIRPETPPEPKSPQKRSKRATRKVGKPSRKATPEGLAARRVTDRYWELYQDRTGEPPSMDAATGRLLKKRIGEKGMGDPELGADRIIASIDRAFKEQHPPFAWETGTPPLKTILSAAVLDQLAPVIHTPTEAPRGSDAAEAFWKTYAQAFELADGAKPTRDAETLALIEPFAAQHSLEEMVARLKIYFYDPPFQCKKGGRDLKRFFKYFDQCARMENETGAEVVRRMTEQAERIEQSKHGSNGTPIRLVTDWENKL